MSALNSGKHQADFPSARRRSACGGKEDQKRGKLTCLWDVVNVAAAESQAGARKLQRQDFFDMRARLRNAFMF